MIIGVIPVLSVYTLDGARVVPADVSKVLVKCDMINLQAFMDNIISNAVRCVHQYVLFMHVLLLIGSVVLFQIHQSNERSGGTR